MRSVAFGISAFSKSLLYSRFLLEPECAAAFSITVSLVSSFSSRPKVFKSCDLCLTADLGYHGRHEAGFLLANYRLPAAWKFLVMILPYSHPKSRLFHSPVYRCASVHKSTYVHMVKQMLSREQVLATRHSEAIFNLVIAPLHPTSGNDLQRCIRILEIEPILKMIIRYRQSKTLKWEMNPGVNKSRKQRNQRSHL